MAWVSTEVEAGFAHLRCHGASGLRRGIGTSAVTQHHRCCPPGNGGQTSARGAAGKAQGSLVLSRSAGRQGRLRAAPRISAMGRLLALRACSGFGQAAFFADLCRATYSEPRLFHRHGFRSASNVAGRWPGLAPDRTSPALRRRP